MPLHDEHDSARAVEVLKTYEKLGLVELDCSRQCKAGRRLLCNKDIWCTVYCCSGQCGGKREKKGHKKGQREVALAVTEKIARATAHPPEYISERLLTCLSDCKDVTAVPFLKPVEVKIHFWAALDHAYLFVLMMLHARGSG